MSDNISYIRHSPDTRAVGKLVEDFNFQALMRRRSWERRWYNTNWFDDGLHFRVVSKRTGAIIDHTQRYTGFVERAIPRASKQIRGIGALLLTPDYYPVVYPERVTQEEFRIKSANPQINGQIDQQAYQMALKKAKENARLQGIFLQRTWEDELELELKLMDMILLTLKNGISFLQVYTNPLTKRIQADVLDAFDVIIYGDARELDNLPFITKAAPIDFNELMSDPTLSDEAKKDLSPDNQYATSEIKEAYMRARYGSKLNAAGMNTIIKRETFMKEYLSDDNWSQAVKLGSDTGAMEGKSKGDMIMRHIFSAGGVTLDDEYVDYDNYPFAEFRMESGPLYQVPVMERFIPLNKTQDIVITRIEKWINTMVAGIWAKRKGENFHLSNLPGGMIAEFEGTPPQQVPIGNVGATPFQFMELTDKYIEEQGLSSNNVSQLPNNIANNTIENIQQQEYTNLRFATARLKKCVTRIGELCIERADKDYIRPVEISYKEDKDVHYFSVIGSHGKKKHKEIGKNLPNDIVTLNRKLKIRVEADAGFGLTQDGRRQALDVLMKNLTELYKEGFMGAEAMALLVKRFVEEYGYGSTEEFAEALENGITQGQMSQQQIQQMQIALLQVLKDAGVAGPGADKKMVESTKLGVLQTMKDVKLLDKLEQSGQIIPEVSDLVNLYKVASPEIQRQIEMKLGLQPATDSPINLEQAKTAKELHTVVKGKKEMEQMDKTAELQQRQQEHTEQVATQEQDNKEREMDNAEQQQEVDNQNTQTQLQQQQQTGQQSANSSQ